MLVALHAELFVHLHPAALVQGEPEAREHRVGLDAGRPDDGVRVEALAVRELRRVLLDRLERRADADLDPALGQLLGRVLAEARRDLRQDLRRCVDEHPALRRALEARVVAQRVADKVGELRERLDPRVAGADEDEGQLALAVVVGGGRVGRVEPLQDVVAQVDRVGEVLEAQRVLGEAWDRQGPRDRAERDHELAVGHGHVSFERVDLDVAAGEVQLGRPAEEHVRMRAHHAQRDDHVARLQGSRGGLGQQRREQHRVLRADDRGAPLAEDPSHVAAGESAADDHGPAACLPLAHASTIAA